MIIICFISDNQFENNVLTCHYVDIDKNIKIKKYKELLNKILLKREILEKWISNPLHNKYFNIEKKNYLKIFIVCFFKVFMLEFVLVFVKKFQVKKK